MLYNFYRMFTSTKKNERYWKNRKIDWQQAYWTPNHSHRELIMKALERFNFGSIFEIGCGAGANLQRIHELYPKTQFGGIDINNDAIVLAKKLLPQAQILDVGVADDIYFSDNSIDVIFTDATLIYIGLDKINAVMKEITRIARNGIVLCEFHSESWWKRLLLKFFSHLNAYNYKKLLEKYGAYDIQITKIPKEKWPVLPWIKYGYIISCRI